MLISRLASEIRPYVAGEQPQEGGWVKLNTNENPYPTAPFEVPFDRAKLRLYPDPDATELKRAVAALHGVTERNVFVGNGSDEVLALAFLALFDANARPVAAPDITYSFYPVFASLFGIRHETVPLETDFSIDFERYRGDYGGIVFANPNAPTSLASDRAEILRLVERYESIPVIADEAYIDFGGESVVGDVLSHENLLVVRTLSKSYSLAGLRVGYAVGSVTLIDALERIKNSFNSYPTDAIAQAIALNAIRRQDVMRANVARVVATRARTVAALRELGFSLPEPSANFVFARPAGTSGKTVFDALKAKKILVRRWDAPRIEEYLRISIGTEEETDRLIRALSEIL